VVAQKIFKPGQLLECEPHELDALLFSGDGAERRVFVGFFITHRFESDSVKVKLFTRRENIQHQLCLARIVTFDTVKREAALAYIDNLPNHSGFGIVDGACYLPHAHRVDVVDAGPARPQHGECFFPGGKAFVHSTLDLFSVGMHGVSLPGSMEKRKMDFMVGGGMRRGIQHSVSRGARMFRWQNANRLHTT
jgi:hypothetical protein